MRCHKHNLNFVTECPDCRKEKLRGQVDTSKLMSYAPRPEGDMLQACPLHPQFLTRNGKGCTKCDDLNKVATRYKTPDDHQKDMLDAIDGLEDKCLKLLAEGKHDKNVRRHNLAANSIEEGFMWLRKAVMKNDDEV